MKHRYAAGDAVYYVSQFGKDSAEGVYKVVRQQPVEGDSRIFYRIKSAKELFERVVDEYQLRPVA